MKQTFEELLENHFEKRDSNYLNINKEDVLELMKLIRLKTIIECSNTAEADVNWLEENLINLEAGQDYEVYVLKESILQLDKNSIEI